MLLFAKVFITLYCLIPLFTFHLGFFMVYESLSMGTPYMEDPWFIFIPRHVGSMLPIALAASALFPWIGVQLCLSLFKSFKCDWPTGPTLIRCGLAGLLYGLLVALYVTYLGSEPAAGIVQQHPGAFLWFPLVGLLLGTSMGYGALLGALRGRADEAAIQG